MMEEQMMGAGQDFGFGLALDFLWAGRRVARRGWNGADMYVELQVPTETSKMKRPYLYMKPVDGGLVPWVASQSDLLDTDWYVVPSDAEKKAMIEAAHGW